LLQINKLLDNHRYKNIKDQFLPEFYLNTSDNLENYWLSGFSDADSSFQIKIVTRKARPKP
jgi:hypothetical protein